MEEKSVAAASVALTNQNTTYWRTERERESERKKSIRWHPEKRQDEKKKTLCRNPLKGLFCATVAAAAIAAVGCESTLTLKWN